MSHAPEVAPQGSGSGTAITGGSSTPALIWARRSFVTTSGLTAGAAPWMLGGDPVEAQWVLLAGAILTAISGFWVRALCLRTKSGRSAWKAEQLCIACGAVLLVLMLIQALNPAYRVDVTGETWKLVQLESVEWLPLSISDAFDGGGGALPVFRNAWRFLLIFGLGWVYAGGLAAGFRERDNARRWARIMGFNAAVLAIVSIVHVASGERLTLWVFAGDAESTGAPVFFQKNHQGAYLAALLALVCGLAGSAKERSERRSWEVIAMLLWVATVVVNSRVATVCATAWVLVYWLVRRRRAERAGEERSARRRWIVLTSVGAGVLALLTVAGATRSVERFTGGRESLWDLTRGGHTRVMVREVGLAMWVDRPLTGWGGGAYPNLFDIYSHKVTSMETYLHSLPPNAARPGSASAKCDWVEFLAEYGVCGLLLMLAIVGVHVRWWIHWRGWKNVMAGFLLAGGLGLLLHACFDSILRNPALLLLFSGLQIAALRLAAPSKGRKSSHRVHDEDSAKSAESSQVEEEADTDGEAGAPA